MTTKDIKQSRLVIGLEEKTNNDEQQILEITKDLDIWSPLCPTLEDLVEKYNFSNNLPKNIEYEVFYLFSARQTERLMRLKEELERQDLNCYISSIF